jgi:hypothetical protein
MNECDFCTQGVRPFYTLEALGKEVKKTICHTCHSLGKHLVKSSPSPRDVPQPLPAGEASSTPKK